MDASPPLGFTSEKIPVFRVPPGGFDFLQHFPCHRLNGEGVVLVDLDSEGTTPQDLDRALTAKPIVQFRSRRGWHVFYRSDRRWPNRPWRTSVRSWSREIQIGGDIRSIGGLVIAWSREEHAFLETPPDFDHCEAVDLAPLLTHGDRKKVTVGDARNLNRRSFRDLAEPPPGEQHGMFLANVAAFLCRRRNQGIDEKTALQFGHEVWLRMRNRDLPGHDGRPFTWREAARTTSSQWRHHQRRAADGSYNREFRQWCSRNGKRGSESRWRPSEARRRYWRKRCRDLYDQAGLTVQEIVDICPFGSWFVRRACKIKRT